MISTQTKNRLSKLENRRFDRAIQKAILSENYSKSLLKGSVKYALESMLPLDKSYMERTFEAAEKIKNHLIWYKLRLSLKRFLIKYLIVLKVPYSLLYVIQEKYL